jgi:putative ABC transport system permease protein
MPMNSMMLFVRTTSEPLSLAGTVRRVVMGVDNNQPIYDVKMLSQRVSNATAASRSLTILFSAFALLALVLGAVGIYGIVSYAVTHRTQEIGIRMALGARSRNVVTQVVGSGIKLAAAGVVVGLLIAWSATRTIESFLFEVAPTDAVTYIAVVTGLLAVTSLAAYLPAKRAAAVDPAQALNDD